jgi:hypothetical protein
MVVEKVLTPDKMPSIFAGMGIESHLNNVRSEIVKTNVYGQQLEITTPDKAQRFSSQSKKRKR